jgi:hypothetical protein
MNKTQKARGKNMDKSQQISNKKDKKMAEVKLTKEEKRTFLKYWKTGIYKQLRHQNLISDIELMQLLEKSSH